MLVTQHCILKQFILRFGFEMEFKQCIGYLKTALTGKHIHTISGNCDRKIATCRWTITILFDFLPLFYVALFRWKGKLTNDFSIRAKVINLHSTTSSTYHLIWRYHRIRHISTICYHKQQHRAQIEVLVSFR